MQKGIIFSIILSLNSADGLGVRILVLLVFTKVY